jgi:hypothetical protein
MSAQAVEQLLASLYTDAGVRDAFFADPLSVARDFGLDDTQAQALAGIDREAVELAARCYAAKRESHASKRKRRWMLRF